MTAHPESVESLCRAHGIGTSQLGVIVVDHGSRRAESNDALLLVVDLFRGSTAYQIVEPAHMELAEPSIETAFDRAVSRGAAVVVVHPYFLSPGRHWADDIPRLVQQAAARHPGVRYLVTAPLGIHPLMATIMDQRIQHCLSHAAGQMPECDVCQDDQRCQLRAAPRSAR